MTKERKLKKKMYRLRTSLIILIIGLFLFSNQLLSIEVHRSRFLVENQPIPQIIAIRGNLPLTDNKFKPENKNLDELSINQGRIEIDSYLLPLINNPELLLIIGPGYMEEMYINQKNKFLPDTMRGVYGSFFGTGDIGEKMFWLTYQSYGLFATELLKIKSSSGKYFQFSTFGYKMSGKLAFQLGFLFNTNYGQNNIIPLIGVAYNWDRFVFNTMLPFLIDIRFIFNENFHILLSGRLLQASYENFSNEIPVNKDDYRYIQISRPELSLQGEWKFYNWSWLQCYPPNNFS